VPQRFVYEKGVIVCIQLFFAGLVPLDQTTDKRRPYRYDGVAMLDVAGKSIQQLPILIDGR